MASPTTMIEVSDLRKHYGPIQAVNGISFSIKKGEIVGFLGPNGAGKTTTMKMLTCFLAPTSGEARVAGHNIQSDTMAVRQAIGYLPEDTPLYKSMTVLEFLRFIAEVREVPPSRRNERIRQVVEICGIQDRLGQTIGTLSKGYRQRVGLAQALVHDPDVLILDEPTSGLDPNQIAEIREVIKALGKEKTLILSTHVLSEVEATCDRVIIIDHGSVVGDGSIEVLAKAREAQAGFVISVEADQPTSKIKERLSGITQIKTVEEIDSHLGPTFIVTPEDEADPRLALMKACVDEGWIILSLTPKAASLEDIFRNLTHGGALTAVDQSATQDRSDAGDEEDEDEDEEAEEAEEPEEEEDEKEDEKKGEDQGEAKEDKQ